MADLAKNEIVEIKAQIKVGDKTYPAGTRFVVMKVTTAKIHLSQLNEDNTISENGINGSITAIQLRFASTGKKYVAPKGTSVEAKKGDFFSFKKEFNDNGIKFPVGTRVVLVKGGQRPEFFTHFTQESGHNVEGLTIYPQFITEHLEAAEAAVCDLTADWKMKGLKERTGEETRNFEFNLYYKGKRVGGASNDGCGGSHRVHVYNDDWKALNKAALEICKAADTTKSGQFSIKAHDVEEYLINFFLDNHNGLSPLKDYLEDQVKDWCKMVNRIKQAN